MTLGNWIAAVFGGAFALAALLVLVAVLLWQSTHPLKPPKRAPIALRRASGGTGNAGAGHVRGAPPAAPNNESEKP